MNRRLSFRYAEGLSIGSPVVSGPMRSVQVQGNACSSRCVPDLLVPIGSEPPTRDRIAFPPLGNTTRMNDARPLADIEWIDAWPISFVGT